MNEFREQLIAYLVEEREISKKEITLHKMMSPEEKEAEGLMIRNAEISITSEEIGTDEYRFRFDNNNTKIRLGDHILLTSNGKDQIKKPLTVLEITPEYMVIKADKIVLDESCTWDIELHEMSSYETYIAILEKMDEASPGAYFLSQLAGEEQPKEESMFGVNPKAIQLSETLTSKLNKAQMNAVYCAIKQPTLRLIQGPPGTGKTHVLSCISKIMSIVGNEVAIVAKTHQAVNNALNSVKKNAPILNVIKVGQELRSDGLDKTVLNFESYKSYLDWRNEKKKKKGTSADVVGMTLQAATVNMCLRNSGFKPQVVLVDEASQIPVAEAAIIGASGAGTIVFIGDDRQMPPIFMEELENDPLSISIFELITKTHPMIKDVLNISYRMNSEICSYVSEHFYWPYGIDLQPGGPNKDKSMIFDCSDYPDKRIEEIFGKDSSSIVTLNVSEKKGYEDDNLEEAIFATQVAAFAMQKGVSKDDIAIVTPFRKQVNAIRSAFLNLDFSEENTPLVDTVERLQGQDVRLIVLSFAVNDYTYYSKIKSFLLNANRINVMISRAKEKVVILKSDMVIIDK